MLHSKLLSFMLVSLLGMTVIGCGGSIPRDALSADNAPILGPLFRKCLVSYYQGKGKKVLDLISQEDRDWNNEWYYEACNLDEEEFCKTLADEKVRLEKLRGTPEYEKLHAEYLTKRAACGDIEIAKSCDSPSSFFQKRLDTCELIRTLGGMNNKRKHMIGVLVQIKLCKEEIHDNDGVLIYTLFGSEIEHKVHFKKENGKWKLLGLKNLHEFERKFDTFLPSLEDLYGT